MKMLELVLIRAAFAVLAVVFLAAVLNSWVMFIQWAGRQCVPLWFCS